MARLKYKQADGTFAYADSPGDAVTGAWSLLMDTTLTEDTSGTCYIPFTDGVYATRMLVIVDESGIEGTTYSSLRFGFMDASKTYNHVMFGNTASGWLATKKWKTAMFECIGGALVRYEVTSEDQLNGYVATPKTGQIYRVSSDYDCSKMGGISYFGTLKAGAKITVYGIRA